jgi:hypothetical protein
MEILRMARKSLLRKHQVEPADVSKVGIYFADNIALFFLIYFCTLFLNTSNIVRFYRKREAAVSPKR